MTQSAEYSPKIGIVIPIYNVAKYLRECLDSVLNQTYVNFCVVLANDGSCDDSLKIGIEYVVKDSRFILIDKANGGLSSARNTGIAYFRNKITFYNDLSSQDSANILMVQGVANTKATQKDNINCQQFCRTNNNDAHNNMPRENANLTIYRNATIAINPPKIDYIIFLDSDDFWENDLLQMCVDSTKTQNPSIVWFDYRAFYDNENIGWGGYTYWRKNSIKNNTTYQLRNERTLIEILGYANACTITFLAFLKNAKEHKIDSFWWAWQGMIDFDFLSSINLTFFEGIIHEDHLFAGLLFAKSATIAIIPQKLYCYRIRKGSTTSAWGKDEIPSYLKPFCAYFPYSKARNYFQIYSLVISVKELMKFANSLPKNAQSDFMAITLPALINIICEIFHFYKDPYFLKAQFVEIIRDLGADSALLPKRVVRHWALYMRHWNVLYVIGILKKIERKGRLFLKEILDNLPCVTK